MSTIVTRAGKGSALSTTEMDANLTNLNTDKLENVVSDTTPQLGGNLDVLARSITTTTTNGNITLAANGNGVIVSGNTHLLNTGTIAAASGQDLTLSAQGATDVIALSQTGGVVITNSGGSGTGLITGATSTGVAMLTNAGAAAATDPAFNMLSGGGSTLSAGTGSALSLVGGTVGVTGTTTISLLKTFTENVHTSTVVTGTYAPSIADGTIHNVTMTGSMTINAFTSPADGQTITLFFNGTGGTFTLTLGSNIKTPADTLALTAGGLDIVTITCIDATTPIYVATAINNFQ